MPASREAGRRGSAGVALLLALAVGSACTDGPDAEWTLQVQETLTVGAEPVSEATAFFEPSALAFDASGRLHVLDTGNNRVQVFDAAGSFLASRGRAGSGPGEMDSPTDLWVAPDGELVVADAGNRRLLRFGAAGEALDAVALDFVPIGVVGTPNRLFVLRLPAAAMAFGPERTALVHAFDRDGTPAGSFVTPEAQSIGILFFLVNTQRIAADGAGGFALVDTHVHGRLRRFDAGGDLAERFGLLYKAEVLAPLGRLPTQINDDSLARVARTSLGVRWDARQNLFWVLAGYVDRRRDGTWVQGNEVYRYTADGEYRGTVPLPREARSLALSPDGSLWILDTEGVAVRYRLRDPDRAR